MATRKVVPLEAEKKYIKLQQKLEDLTIQRDEAKLRLLKYHERGYEFRLIRPSDTSNGVFSPPWKVVALELRDRIYKTKKTREKFMAKLLKRFPKTERAPSLNIIGKEVSKDA